MTAGHEPGSDISSHSWVVLPADDELIEPDLKRAISAFDAGPLPAARAAVDWLQHDAVAQFSTSRTHLLLVDGSLAGFYSLASAHAVLTQRHRKMAGVTRPAGEVPATLVTWIAKALGGPVDGDVLLLHAVATARRSRETIATALLVVDAYDDATARMWRERYGFRPAQRHGRGQRLWLPLDAAT